MNLTPEKRAHAERMVKHMERQTHDQTSLTALRKLLFQTIERVRELPQDDPTIRCTVTDLEDMLRDVATEAECYIAAMADNLPPARRAM